jgi:ribosomal protein L2
MNIVDHPMGGKTQGSGGKGKPKKTMWGKLAK